MNCLVKILAQYKVSSIYIKLNMTRFLEYGIAITKGHFQNKCSLNVELKGCLFQKCFASSVWCKTLANPCIFQFFLHDEHQVS